MGSVVALRNTHTMQYRLVELKMIALLVTEAEQLYGSVRLWTLPAKRKLINARGDALIQEAIVRAERYYTSVGLPVPEHMFRNFNQQ